MDMKFYRLMLSLLALSLLLVGCTAAPRPLGGGRGQIVFASERDGNLELYMQNVDGSGLRRLTTNPASDITPVWSPDGKQVAFVSDRDHPEKEIYLLNVADLSVTRLTNNQEQENNPAWSPDGKRIVYVAVGQDKVSQIYVMNADGSNPQRLTEAAVGAFFPAWSPNGKRIAYSAWDNHSLAIYVMNADGSQPVRLTEGFDINYAAAWSPDSSQLLYVSGITTDIVPSGFMFSKEGNLFAMGPEGQYDLHLLEDIRIKVIKADGSSVINFKTFPSWTDPVWSPDGKYIAYVNTPADDSEICIMKIDGTGSMNLSNSPGLDYTPDW
jgi:Tol biopolymer transport system component